MDSILNLYKQPKESPDFDAVKIQIASPEKIRAWSFGEVTKPETINYRTFKPERNGLFCAKIFGPTKDWECVCGKYKRMKHRGVVCDKCGVEVIQSKVRRERLGHIELACPVSHVWFFKGLPSRIGHLLDMSLRELEKILYFEMYVVLNSGNTKLKEKDFITEEEYQELKAKYSDSYEAGMGAEAIKKLLQQIDPSQLAEQLRKDIKETSSLQKRKKLTKRLKVVEAFRKSGNRPEWMILDVIPVLPPELRPLVPLDGGHFATSDLNDLYRRVINRNNRLKRLQELKAPEVIIRNEKRMLQESVDALFDNGRRGRSIKGPNNRPLRSLSDMLKGKQGRFRQNLLGKRVDYSGRSVIVIGPELKLNQCGLPKQMALELFKPFILNKLDEKGYATTIKTAKRMIELQEPVVWDILEEIIQDHPVLLNRAPTLHRLGIQAFQPILVEGKAIKIHPLVCFAFNADFDGDQMAVHVPLSIEAQLESKILMLSTNNILSPANGTPVVAPTKDIVLGCYYLTKARPDAKGEGKIFSNANEVMLAFDMKEVDLHAKIFYRITEQSSKNGVREIHQEIIETTVGRVFFNEILPEGWKPFFNELTDKSKLKDIIAKCYRNFGHRETVLLLDRVKELGFEYATRAGISISLNNMHVPSQKETLIRDAQKHTAQVEIQYSDGIITNGERYNKVIDIWSHVTERVADEMFKELIEGQARDEFYEKSSGEFNPIFMMADSGSQGSKQQLRQLAGMRGLMAKPSGEIIETPITANFREGLTVLEYFISTHGARKGLADTALKTADSGYLTRRLVDVAQDVIIREVDCKTLDGIIVTSIIEAGEVIEQLKDRILGRVTLDDIHHPYTNEIIVKANEEIDEEKALLIEDAGIEEVKIRSVLTCESKEGVCAMCYGRNLATGKLVNLGEAVGVIAAQSIGEPGTQLTMRTFHIGGTARVMAESKHYAKHQGSVMFKSLQWLKNEDADLVAMNRNGVLIISDDQQRERERHKLVHGARIKFFENETVEPRDLLVEWDPFSSHIIAKKGGYIKEIDIIEGKTMKEDIDNQTGKTTRVIVASQDEGLQPKHIIWNPEASTFVYVQRSKDKDKCSLSIKVSDKLVGDMMLLLLKENNTRKIVLKNFQIIMKKAIRTLERNINLDKDYKGVKVPQLSENIVQNFLKTIEDKYLDDKTERNIQKVISEEMKSSVQKMGKLIQVQDPDLGEFNSASVRKLIENSIQLVEENVFQDKKFFENIVKGNDLVKLIDKDLRKIFQNAVKQVYSRPDYMDEIVSTTKTVEESLKSLVQEDEKGIISWEIMVELVHRILERQVSEIKSRVTEKFNVSNDVLKGFEICKEIKVGPNLFIDFGKKLTEAHFQLIFNSTVKKFPISLFDMDHYSLPERANLIAVEDEYVATGAILVKIPRETAKTKDITGGLPRVVELFEARKPKELATISEMDGVVSFGPSEKGMKQILVKSDDGTVKEYFIPIGKHISVHEGDRVKAGETLVDGSSNPHDILHVLGDKELQKYLVDEVQEVYRLQGVDINDKHIEVIVRQMLKQVRIDDPGDTEFLLNEQVDKFRFKEENKKVITRGGKPAKGSPLLLGITKASLSTDSFISSASFQETTRVLTEVSISGKVDYLKGLKENVIVGRLIPAGTGMKFYRSQPQKIKNDKNQTTNTEQI